MKLRWLMAGAAMLLATAAAAQTWTDVASGDKTYQVILQPGEAGKPPVIVVQEPGGKSWVYTTGKAAIVQTEAPGDAAPAKKSTAKDRANQPLFQSGRQGKPRDQSAKTGTNYAQIIPGNITDNSQTATNGPQQSDNTTTNDGAKLYTSALTSAAVDSARNVADSAQAFASTVSQNSASDDAVNGDMSPAAAPSAAAVCDSVPSVSTLIPCGPLSTKGGQIIAQDGSTVRLNCVAWWGSLPDEAMQMGTIVTSGGNCLRVSWFNASKSDNLAWIDGVVKLAAQFSLRVIVNDHANEGTNGGCNAQQANGLWYDVGGASDGTDGCETRGTVTDAKWVSDWVEVAARYKGNNTVIGYDLWNEPTNYGKGSCWACGDPNRDIRAAYERAGNAIQSVDSDKLIIAEGSQDYSQGAAQGDLRLAGQFPVRLKVPNKVVYSVHEYPTTVAGSGKPNDGAAYCQNMKEIWGYLVTGNIAPVWIGETGASMITASDSAWANTITDCLESMAPAATDQTPGWCWWMWHHCDNCGNPNGILQADLVNTKPEQMAVFSKGVQRAVGRSGKGTNVAYGQQISMALGSTPMVSTVATQVRSGPPVDQQEPSDDEKALTAAPRTTGQVQLPASLTAQQRQNDADIQSADDIVAAAIAKFRK